MLKEILRDAKENKRFVGIWIYGDSDGFWSGYIQDYNDDFVVIEHYTKFGKYDGIIVEKIDNIESIDFNDDYSDNMEYIIAYNHLLDKKNEKEIELNDFENWQYCVLNPLLNDSNSVVRIYVAKENYYHGFVTDINKEHLVLKIIDSNGDNSRNTIYKINDISSIQINDIESRKRLLLYNWKTIV